MPIRFMRAVKDLTEVMRFESWLRFYFVNPQGECVRLEVPEKACEQIKVRYPSLCGLVDRLNDQEITYESSTRAVCEFVAETIDGQKHQAGSMERVFDSPEFKTEMELFHTWLDSHESQLEQGFLDFEAWTRLFEEWKNSDQVKEFFAQRRQARQ